MKTWKKREQNEIKEHVFTALKENINYYDEGVLGVPASHLDDKVFNRDETFLKDAPYISTLVNNPNHIGYHTSGVSESFFKGTQAIEREVITICAEDILKAQPDSVDGYVASGGTEANIQAMWIYRNYFMHEKNASLNEISIVCSADTHYSVYKAANLLSIDVLVLPVNENSRMTEQEQLREKITLAKAAGKKYFIVISNMMTTMFGSVDDIDMYGEFFTKEKLAFFIHVDGAFGGFYYPFSNPDSRINFSNPYVTSVTLDAHKMAQAPYGTGIFLIRKGFMHYTHTQKASYVEGEDSTLIGSRSGANAVAIWMILAKHGPHGWFEKILVLQKRTDWLCAQLNARKVEFYRHAFSNIVTMRSKHIEATTAARFGLVPDSHQQPQWYKIVVMDHVTVEKMEEFLRSLG